MIIAKYILKKILTSNFIIISSFISLFFIISLVDNLNLKTNFFYVILISLLDSLSLIIIVPEVIFLFCCLCFCILLKFSNELLIIRHYLDKKIILFFFILFILLYFLTNFSKNQIDEAIDLTKYNLLNQNLDNFIKNKVVVTESSDEKIIYELSDIDLISKNIGSIKIHKYEDNYFKSTLSSENIKYNENIITLYSPTLITSKNITKVNGKYNYNLKFLNRMLYSNDEILYLNDYKYVNYSYNIIVKILNFTILLITLSMVFISKKILKNNLITFIYTLLCLILVIYNFMINFINVQFFEVTFISLGIFINLTILLYFYLDD